MNNGNANAESKARICGIVILLGAAVCCIPIFTLVTYAFRGESPFAFTFLLRHLAWIAGFATIGTGVFANKHDLFKIGLFISAAGFAIDTYFPLMWISSDADYYGSLSRALGGGTTVNLLYCLAAIAGFVLMGILFSQKREWQNPNLKTIAKICIAAYIVLAVLYTFYYIDEYYLTLKEYLSSYINGASVLSVVGAAGVLMMPSAFSDDIPDSQVNNSTGTGQKTIQQIPQVEQIDSEPVKKEMNLDAAFDLLRKYKQLAEAGVITEEEFQAKKAELLK